jgi:hypothetical protein
MAASVFVRYCTAVYGITSGDMLAAARQLRAGLTGLQSLQASSEQKAGSKGVLLSASSAASDTCHQLLTEDGVVTCTPICCYLLVS